MLKKFALCEAAPLDAKYDNKQMIRTASGNVIIEPDSEKSKIIEAEIKKHPTALFFRAKAIVADETNSNGDYFPEDELLGSYKSFEGVPFFSNHDNQNVENARGKIIFAEWVPEEKAVYTIAFVDREAFPHICRGIEQDYISGVSMGCSVEYSVCSICGNKAEKTDDYCSHIRNRKGRTFSGSAKNVRTGEIREFRNASVYEENYGIKFIELSAVVDPACASCHIEGIIPKDDFLAKKVANVQNSLFMLKTANLEKVAGQQEIEQLNQCLGTLEELSVNLIQNRQQIEVEFASDLVKILSDLQEFTDELIGAGYGNVQGGVVPGTDPMGQGGMEGAEMMQPPEGSQTFPVADETPLSQADVGTVSGQPSQPLVQSPQLPISAPAKPMANSKDKVIKLAERLENLNNKLNDILKDNDDMEEDEMAKRRTRLEATKQKHAVSEKLSNLWEEKQEFLGYINRVPSIKEGSAKLSVKTDAESFIIVAENVDNQDEYRVWTYDDLTSREKEIIKGSPEEASDYFLGLFNKARQDKEGVSKMAKDERVLKEAAKDIPETITQDQLDTSDGAMPRENTERNSITEQQLKNDNGSHSRSETPNYTTEKQLENQSGGAMPRENAPRETITQDQLNTSQGASPRTGEEANTITTNQLEQGGYKTNEEPNVTTEKQLSNGNAPWDRTAARDASLFKGASEHMDAVVSVLADASIATGSTPDEIVAIAGSLVDSTSARYRLAEAILEESDDKSEVIDYKKRLAFWSGKNIKVSSVGKKDISAIIVSGLRAVASDQTINPELILDAVDVASDGEEGVQAVSTKIDEKLSQEEETVTVSKRDELRAALKSTVASEEVVEEKVEAREVERKQWDAELNEEKPDTMIEASMDEIGLEDKGVTEENIAVLEANRKSISSFVKGALAANNVKLAAITNVTVDGDTVQIAVQTGEGEESVEIPLAGEEIAEEADIIPEGDLAGEAADIIDTELPDVPTEAATYASKGGKQIKIAQSPMGGGVPGTPGDVAGGPGAPEMGMEGMPPAGQGVETLTDDVEEEVLEDEIPEAGEKQPPYAICPECGSNDVDLENADAGVKGACNNCGAEYEALIKKDIEFIITKPTKSVGDEGGVTELEEPEVPALPVAAQTKLTPNSIKRIASNKDQHGHVCPVCGMDNCKPQIEKEASAEYHCPACDSDITKDVVINVNNPDESYLRVKWLVTPDFENCTDCKEAASKFASMVKVAKRVKEAANDEFPMANCMERVARRFGGNAVATYGPCKGKPLADCLCNQLEALGMRKQRHIERLGSVYTQKDPMDECLEDQKSKGLSDKQADTICGCLKKKFASETDDNPFLMAFAEDVEAGSEKTLSIDELRAINDYVNEEMLSKEAAIDDIIDEELEEDIGVDLPDDAAGELDGEVDLVEELEDEVTEVPEEETVTIELSDEAAEELSEALADAGAGEVELVDDGEVSEEILEDEVIEGTPELEGVTEIEVAEISPEDEKEMALAMKENRLRRVGEEVVKVASKPKVIKDIEQDVEAGVPRAKATMGNESAENIDVPMAKPTVPRAKATMGEEGADNIDVPMSLPDVAVDSSYMGVNEKANQADMPAINNEIRGRVVAKKLKEVDTVEGDVEAGVPRAKATMGNEGADNIDVPAAKPDVPRANAEMGEEGADNINPKADAPDVPVSDAYMGHEKEVQKDMPKNNDEYLTRVQAKQDLQRERIANARWKKATLVASKLLGEGKIDSAAMEDIVQALSQFGLDEIEAKAESMFGKVVTASSEKKQVTASSGLGTPAIVLETPSEAAAPEQSFQDRIASQFTIGNHAFSQKLEEEGMK